MKNELLDKLCDVALFYSLNKIEVTGKCRLLNMSIVDKIKILNKIKNKNVRNLSLIRINKFQGNASSISQNKIKQNLVYLFFDDEPSSNGLALKLFFSKNNIKKQDDLYKFIARFVDFNIDALFRFLNMQMSDVELKVRHLKFKILTDLLDNGFSLNDVIENDIVNFILIKNWLKFLNYNQSQKYYNLEIKLTDLIEKNRELLIKIKKIIRKNKNNGLAIKNIFSTLMLKEKRMDKEIFYKLMVYIINKMVVSVINFQNIIN